MRSQPNGYALVKHCRPQCRQSLYFIHGTCHLVSNWYNILWIYRLFVGLQYVGFMNSIPEKTLPGFPRIGSRPREAMDMDAGDLLFHALNSHIGWDPKRKWRNQFSQCAQWCFLQCLTSRAYLLHNIHMFSIPKLGLWNWCLARWALAVHDSTPLASPGWAECLKGLALDGCSLWHFHMLFAPIEDCIEELWDQPEASSRLETAGKTCPHCSMKIRDTECLAKPSKLKSLKRWVSHTQP